MWVPINSDSQNVEFQQLVKDKMLLTKLFVRCGYMMGGYVHTWIIAAIIVLTFLANYTECNQLVGGPCYSLSQDVCNEHWTNLWIASYERRNNDMCRLFAELHVCTTKFSVEYASRCPFQEREQKLYQQDIVDIYTSPPYKCPLIGGNIELAAQYGWEHNMAQATSLTSSTLTLGVLIHVITYWSWRAVNIKRT